MQKAATDYLVAPTKAAAEDAAEDSGEVDDKKPDEGSVAHGCDFPGCDVYTE